MIEFPTNSFGDLFIAITLPTAGTYGTGMHMVVDRRVFYTPFRQLLGLILGLWMGNVPVSKVDFYTFFLAYFIIACFDDLTELLLSCNHKFILMPICSPYLVF